MSLSLRLEAGLGGDRVSALADLLSDISGHPLEGDPWMAPTLLLADPLVQSAFPMPQPGPEDVLIHDYQSVEMKNPLPQDVALDAVGTARSNGMGCEIDIDIGGDVTMKTALRVIPADDLAAAKPLAVRLAPDTPSMALGAISQADVDRYLALSGDTNPLHQADGPATAVGLSGPVVPGLLLAGLCQFIAERDWPGRDVGKLRVRFAAPVPVGTPLCLHLQVRGERRARAILSKDGFAFSIMDLEADLNLTS